MSRRYPDRDPPLDSPSHFLVVDLEATCDAEGWPREAREVIEIGAVLVEADALAEVGSFCTFVRPVRRPALTAFCTALTSITQADVDAAPDCGAAIDALMAALPAPRPVFCSWGGFDARLFARECARRGRPDPMPPHWDLRAAFSARLRVRRRFGVQRALARVERAFAGTPHRALDDARNAAALLPWCLGRAVFPAEPPRWVRRQRARAEAEAAARRGRLRRESAGADGA